MKRKVKHGRARLTWTPLEQASGVTAVSLASIAATFGSSPLDTAGFKSLWCNDIYQVAVYELEPVEGSDMPVIVWLSIKRRDRQAIRDWRHFQLIKNQLVGPECEGVELFPAESRLVDSANQYHLYVIKDPEVRFPFGFAERLVSEDTFGGVIAQRPFEVKPPEVQKVEAQDG